MPTSEQRLKLHTDREIGFAEVLVKTSVVHVLTYFVAGVTAMVLLQYKPPGGELAGLFRSFDHPLVMAGPLLQIVRGLVFASAFYLLRDVLFRARHGWLVLFWVLVSIGVLSTFGPPPGSIEAMIYTTLPISIFNYLEVAPQALGLSFLLGLWIANPQLRWLSWGLYGAVGLIALMITAGLVAG